MLIFFFSGSPAVSLFVLSCRLSYGKNRSNQQAEYLRTYFHSDSVTKASGLRPGGGGGGGEVVGSIPGRVIPTTLKMVRVLAALSFALSIEKAELVGPLSV